MSYRLTAYNESGHILYYVMNGVWSADHKEATLLSRRAANHLMWFTNLDTPDGYHLTGAESTKIRWTVLWNDVINGIYSGFPLCCVAYFVYVKLFYGWAVASICGFEHIGYVRCPSCRKRKKVVQVRDGSVNWRSFIKFLWTGKECNVRGTRIHG
jgi:hypothetical protein